MENFEQERESSDLSKRDSSCYRENPERAFRAEGIWKNNRRIGNPSL